MSPGYAGSVGTLRDIQLAVHRHLISVTNGGDGGLAPADVARSFYVFCAFWNSDKVAEPGSTLLTNEALAAIREKLRREYGAKEQYLQRLNRTAVWSLFEVILCFSGTAYPLQLTPCREPPYFKLPQLPCPTEGPIYVP